MKITAYLMFKDNIIAMLSVDEYGFELIETYSHIFPARNSAEIHKWWSNRQTPYSRTHIMDVYKYAGIKTLIDFVKVTKFVSVNDCWWIKTDDKQTWKSVNVFDNHFTRFISDLSLLGYSNDWKEVSAIYNPEFSLGGSFPKTWIHKNGRIYLMKSSNGAEGELKNSYVYSEVLCSQLCDFLGFEKYVKYCLTKYKDIDVCICESFTNEKVMFYPYVYYTSGNPSYDDVKRDLGQFEIFYQMTLLDYLTLNRDRHTGNYGYLVDSDTFDFIGMSPIFDNNNSLLSEEPLMTMCREDILSYLLTVKSRFDEPVDKLSMYLVRDYKKSIDYCRKLLSFNFNKIGDINELRLNRLSAVVRMQAKRLLSLCGSL